MQACRKPVITNPVPTNHLFCSEFVTLGNTHQPPAALYINLLITSSISWESLSTPIPREIYTSRRKPKTLNKIPFTIFLTHNKCYATENVFFSIAHRYFLSINILARWLDKSYMVIGVYGPWNCWHQSTIRKNLWKLVHLPIILSAWKP